MYLLQEYDLKRLISQLGISKSVKIQGNKLQIGGINLYLMSEIAPTLPIIPSSQSFAPPPPPGTAKLPQSASTTPATSASNTQAMANLKNRVAQLELIEREEEKREKQAAKLEKQEAEKEKRVAKSPLTSNAVPRGPAQMRIKKSLDELQRTLIAMDKRNLVQDKSR